MICVSGINKRMPRVKVRSRVTEQSLRRSHLTLGMPGIEVMPRFHDIKDIKGKRKHLKQSSHGRRLSSRRILIL